MERFFFSWIYSFSFNDKILFNTIAIFMIQHFVRISLFTHQDTSTKQRFSSLNGRHQPIHPRGILQNVLSEEAPPRGPTPYPYIPFWTEKVSFSNTFYWRMIPLSYTLFRFLDFFTAINWSVRPFGPLHRPKSEISQTFYTPSIRLAKEQENLRYSKIPTLSYTWGMQKVPLWSEPSCIGHYFRYPLRGIRTPQTLTQIFDKRKSSYGDTFP